MGFWTRKPRFREVPTVAPELPRPKKVIFFAPHTGEHPAVMPLVSVLSEKLSRRGIEAETHSVNDMGERVREISGRLRKMPFRDRDKEMIDALFRLQDAHIRLQILGRLLAENPEANIIEMHALDRDYQEKSVFTMKEWFYRIPGTRVLHLGDLKGEYRIAIDDGLETADKLCVAGALPLFSLDVPKIRGMAPGLLRTLEENLHRTIMIEIPAPAHCNCEGVPALTVFERNYGYSFSEPHTLGDVDVYGILHAITGRKDKLSSC